jgi:hypothetical protein
MEPKAFLSNLENTHIAPMYGTTWCNETLLFINDIFLVVIRRNPIIFK